MTNAFAHSLFTGLTAFALAVSFLGVVAFTGDNLKEQVAAYIAAHNRRDMDKAMSYLAEDFRIVFVKHNFRLSKEELKKNLGWDYGANARTKFEELKVEDNAVSGIFTESNDFYKALGIKGMKARVTYRFNDKGLIEEQLYEDLPGQPDYKVPFKPALEWIRERYPDDLAKIYPDNKLVYTEEAARRWVVLLKEWRKATGRDKD